jgi:hypothetical protein
VFLVFFILFDRISYRSFLFQYLLKTNLFIFLKYYQFIYFLFFEIKNQKEEKYYDQVSSLSKKIFIPDDKILLCSYRNDQKLTNDNTFHRNSRHYFLSFNELVIENASLAHVHNYNIRYLRFFACITKEAN